MGKKNCSSISQMCVVQQAVGTFSTHYSYRIEVCNVRHFKFKHAYQIKTFGFLKVDGK